MALSASADRCAEDIRISPIVVTELKFRDVERHVLRTLRVQCAHHATLEDRPEAFDCLSV